MCDTLVLRQDGVSWLAKNSDREPGEPQLWRYYPAVSSTQHSCGSAMRKLES